MKRYEKWTFLLLLVLLVASFAAMVFTRSWSDYRERLRAVQVTSSRARELVDTRPLDTAQQLAALAVTRTEQDDANEALRLADHSVDLAFAAAIYDASEHPAPLTSKTRELAARIKADEASVAADQNRVAQFTKALATAGPAAKDDLQGLIVTAQAQLALDQDDLDDAQQQLVLAGGDKQARIQQLLDQHHASDAHAASVQSGAAASSASTAAGAPSIERTQSRSIVAQSQAWLSLRAKELQLIQAQQSAQALATSLSASRVDLQKEMEQQQSAKEIPQPNATASPSADNASSAAPGPQESATAVLRRLSAEQKNLADFGNRIDTEQQLAAVYGNWIAFVSAREQAFLHGIFVSIFFALLVILVVLLANYGIQRFFAQITQDRRNLRTIQALTLFLVQAVGVLLVLLVIFGVPSNLATVLALATAGLTVAMKDFIVGFFGWFVLMGKDGIRPGDWVEINGVGGEVLQVGLLHTVVLETGNWTDAGHPTGRKVSFVNSFAIEGHYFNFSTAGQWLWDQIQVQVPDTAEPYATADAIQKIAAQETAENARLAESEWSRVITLSRSQRSFSAAPSLSVQPAGSSVTVIVRYITRASERYEVRARIYRAVVDLLHAKKIRESAASVSAPAAPLASKSA
jgi:small-conductance mechanosensitive channel